jgi:hypothetical protein
MNSVDYQREGRNERGGTRGEEREGRNERGGEGRNERNGRQAGRKEGRDQISSDMLALPVCK